MISKPAILSYVGDVGSRTHKMPYATWTGLALPGHSVVMVRLDLSVCFSPHNDLMKTNSGRPDRRLQRPVDGFPATKKSN